MAWPLILAGAAGVMNLIGNLFNEPQNDQIDIEKIMRIYSEGAGRDAERTASQVGTSAAQRAGGQGLTGGAFTQAVGEAEAPVYNALQQKLNEMRLNLTMADQERTARYKQAHRQWKGNIFGDVAGAMGGVGGALTQQNALIELSRILGVDKGGDSSGDGEKQTVQQPQTLLDPNVSPPTSLVGGQQNNYTYNPWTESLRNNYYNQWNRPWEQDLGMWR